MKGNGKSFIPGVPADWAIAVDPASTKDWDEALQGTPGGSFFHTSAWADVLRDSYHYRPLYLVAPDRTIANALLPIMEVDSPVTGRRGVSLPFTDYCDPIASSATDPGRLFGAAAQLGRKRNWKYLEIRGGSAFLNPAENSQWYYGHRVELRNYDMNALSGATARNIRKAEKQNLSLSITRSADALESFCRLNAQTRRTHGLPPQPRRFFNSIHRHILARNRGFIVSASLAGRMVAAALYFTFGEQVLFKYGASDRAFQHLRANNLVMWKAIQWSMDQGYGTLCLGRTEPDNEGLRRYKTGWGAQERVIRYYRYDLRGECFVEAPQTVRSWQKKYAGKLPLPFLNMVGRVLYRHVG